MLPILALSPHAPCGLKNNGSERPSSTSAPTPAPKADRAAIPADDVAVGGEEDSKEGGVGDANAGAGVNAAAAAAAALPGDGSTNTRTCPTTPSKATPGLVVSSRWTLESLHGENTKDGVGSLRRRRRRRSSVGAGEARGTDGDDRSGDNSNSNGNTNGNVNRNISSGSGVRCLGEVGVGLVKRSMDMSLGRLEIWPDPPVLGRISHLIRCAFAAKDVVHVLKGTGAVDFPSPPHVEPSSAMSISACAC